MYVCVSDGYPMQDVVMKWRGTLKDDAVHGVMEVAIPQFTIVDYKTVTTKEVLDTGQCTNQCSISEWSSFVLKYTSCKFGYQ
jgi:hypothetical protein